MMINDCFKVRSFVLIAVLSVGFGSISPAFASPTFIIDVNSKVWTELGSLGIGDFSGAFSGSGGINNQGQVVGGSFITGPNGVGMTALGINDAFDVNDAGQVAGVIGRGGGDVQAVITGPNGVGWTKLGTLGGESSEAYSINDNGQVVGRAEWKAGSRHAFITSPDGVGMRDLGTLGGAYSEAAAINDAGQVVGFSSLAGIPSGGEQPVHAFITGPDGVGMTDLTILGGLGWANIAHDVNSAGQVAGWFGDEFGGHAFITGPNGVAMRDLGTLGGSDSWAYGINDAGQVVGMSNTRPVVINAGSFESRHAFITGPDGMGMTDLNSLVDLPDGYVLETALAINDRGQVLAMGVVPEPKTFALLLAGLGLVGFAARRNYKKDVKT